MNQNISISTDPKATALRSFNEEILPKIVVKGASVGKAMSIKDIIVEESDIVLCSKIDANANALYFYILKKDKTGIHPLELFLDEKDLFFGHEQGVFIQKVIGEDFSSPLYSYIEKEVFDGVTTSGLKESDALEAVFNGLLNILRNKKGIINNTRIRNFMFAPDRQISDGVYPNMNDDAFKKLTKKPVFSGKDDLEMRVDLGKMSQELRALIQGNVDNTGAAKTDRQNYMFIVYRGFLASNVSQYHEH